MDFKLNPEQEALKKEFEAFFAEEEKNAPKSWVGGHEEDLNSKEGWAYHSSVKKKLAQKGWLTLPWPKKYGGREFSHIDQVIFNESWSYHRVPGFKPSGFNDIGTESA